MYARHPKLAKRWSAEYPNQGKLPKRIRKRAGQLYKSRNKQLTSFLACHSR